MEMAFYSIVRFFQMGGVFMFPIALVLAVGLAIAFERWVHLKRVRDANQKTWDSLYPALAKGEFDKAREMANKDKSSLAQMMGIIPQLEKRTQYLALLSNIATLFGLLGTIMGLIEAFTTVATASPAEKAALLSASISVAMNCTAFGLMTAIPLLLLHARLTTTRSEER